MLRPILLACALATGVAVPTIALAREAAQPVQPPAQTNALGAPAAPAVSELVVARAPALRPPAVPLVAHDPYFSVWSSSDQLAGSETRHWTGAPHPLHSMVRVDGRAFRLMGSEPVNVPAMPQVGVQVLPTRTVYTFANEQVRVTLTFLTPALPHDLEVLARPITYLTWQARSLDRQEHAVGVYFDASALLAVNEGAQPVTAGTLFTRQRVGTDVRALRISSAEQPILQKKGDNLRIDWGHLLVAAAGRAQQVLAPRRLATSTWAQSGTLPPGGLQFPRAASDDDPVAAIAFDLGRVGAQPTARWAMIGYDDEYSITLMGRRLRPYWRRDGATTEDLLAVASRDYVALRDRCARFDEELMAELRAAGGENYARLAALSHRQALAANKLVADSRGAPLYFSKENFSNGCIATVDVSYPALPQLLLLSPTLAKASLVPILNYAASERWKFPFAPHDIGTYPIANGQVYGGGERTEDDQMPVEESGNMLILMAAIRARRRQPRLRGSLVASAFAVGRLPGVQGFDPENQLCTDDFAGHLAHNVNLSAKAIMALACYAQLCDARGEAAAAQKYRAVARDMMARWLKAADDGGHFRLAFDRPGTWSQKYNLVWDQLLGLDIVPRGALDKELASYRTRMNPYGLPLDNRDNYTKLDWTVWTATLARDPRYFEDLVAPILKFANDTPDRNPLTDWYRTVEPRQVGFQARSVVGGVFIKLLDDETTWARWARRDALNARLKASSWAAQPLAPLVTEVVATSRRAAQKWRYTLQPPAGNWQAANFDDAAWQSGAGRFWNAHDAGRRCWNEWSTPDIWARREFTLPANWDARAAQELQLLMHHDEATTVYINGVLAAQTTGFSTDYTPVRAFARPPAPRSSRAAT
jgi:hypothetical protein